MWQIFEIDWTCAVEKNFIKFYVTWFSKLYDILIKKTSPSISFFEI